MMQEMIHLHDPTYPIKDTSAQQAPVQHRAGRVENFWMPTLRTSMGTNIHCMDLRNQPNISIGGYFLLSQMIGFVHSLFSLNLSSNGLRAAEARVLALGLTMNKSLMVVRSTRS